jgi:hypothetical protein
VIIAGWVLIALGFVVYLAAFARGAGPTMGDDPIQATFFTLATIFMITGFVFVAVI